MKVCKATGEELFSGSLAVDDGGLFCSTVRLSDAVDFDLPPLSVVAEPDKQGLRLNVDLPGAGIDPVHVIVEYDDMKALKKMPGKGFVSFVLKSLR